MIFTSRTSLIDLARVYAPDPEALNLSPMTSDQVVDKILARFTEHPASFASLPALRAISNFGRTKIREAEPFAAIKLISALDDLPNLVSQITTPAAARKTNKLLLKIGKVFKAAVSREVSLLNRQLKDGKRTRDGYRMQIHPILIQCGTDLALLYRTLSGSNLLSDHLACQRLGINKHWRQEVLGEILDLQVRCADAMGRIRMRSASHQAPNGWWSRVSSDP